MQAVTNFHLAIRLVILFISRVKEVEKANWTINFLEIGRSDNSDCRTDSW